MRVNDFGCGKLIWKHIQKESFLFLLRNESYLIINSWYWWQMKEHFIILTNLTFQHLCLYWSHFSIAEYMRCQLIATLHFDFSKRFSAVFVMFFNRLHLAISFIGWWYYRIFLFHHGVELFSTPKRKKIFWYKEKKLLCF